MSTVAPATTAAVDHRGRVPDVAFRWDAVSAVAYREWRVFRRIWRSVAFGSVVEPLIYLVAFGFGFGALVAEVAGIPYLDFIATGSAGVSVLFTGFFPGLINGYFRRSENHLYDGVLATPTTVAELVTGEAAWTGLRTAGTTAITLVVAALLGVDLTWWVFVTPVVGYLGGVAFHCLGAAFAATMRTTHEFDYVIAGVVVPMFVVAGTFFPLDGAPWWLRWPATINPLTHVVDLFRFLALGVGTTGDALVGLVVLLGAVAGSWLLAVRRLGRALVA